MLNEKTTVCGVCAVQILIFLATVVVPFRATPITGDNENTLWAMGQTPGGGAVAGRIVSIPVRAYKEAFKDTLKLGQCPLVMAGKIIKTCNVEFAGDEVYLAKGSMIVDVANVKTNEDVLTHIMGSVGGSVSVLGLVGISAEINVAVTTETKKENLNLMSSYEMQRGVLSLHNPTPKTPVPLTTGSLFLSEITLGGSEVFLVTLEFATEQQKVAVEYNALFNLLFWSISLKVAFVYETLKINANVRITFESSWREKLTIEYDDLGAAIPKIKEIEAMYMKGPQVLKSMDINDQWLHSYYHFSSWSQSPYEANINLALINHDLEHLTKQNTEILSVIHRINELSHLTWAPEKRTEISRFNDTLVSKSNQLSEGLNKFHILSPSQRQGLRDVYGEEKAPLYYSRELNGIIGNEI